MSSFRGTVRDHFGRTARPLQRQRAATRWWPPCCARAWKMREGSSAGLGTGRPEGPPPARPTAGVARTALDCYLPPGIPERPNSTAQRRTTGSPARIVPLEDESPPATVV